MASHDYGTSTCGLVDDAQWAYNIWRVFKRHFFCSLTVNLTTQFNVFFLACAIHIGSPGHRLAVASCYTKCLTSVFGYSKYSSVTAMLMELCMPSFNTLSLIHNYNVSLVNRLNVRDNILVKRTMILKLWYMWFTFLFILCSRISCCIVFCMYVCLSVCLSVF